MSMAVNKKEVFGLIFTHRCVKNDFSARILIRPPSSPRSWILFHQLSRWENRQHRLCWSRNEEILSCYRNETTVFPLSCFVQTGLQSRYVVLISKVLAQMLHMMRKGTTNLSHDVPMLIVARGLESRPSSFLDLELTDNRF